MSDSKSEPRILSGRMIGRRWPVNASPARTEFGRTCVNFIVDFELKNNVYVGVMYDDIGEAKVSNGKLEERTFAFTATHTFTAQNRGGFGHPMHFLFSFGELTGWNGTWSTDPSEEKGNSRTKGGASMSISNPRYDVPIDVRKYIGDSGLQCLDRGTNWNDQYGPT